MRVIEQLAELAEVDRELVTAADEPGQIDARAGGDPEALRLEAHRAELEAEAARRTAARRTEELELEALGERRRHQERALYDGSVRHPGDLQRRQHEIQGLRQLGATHEERVLAAMEAEEAAQAELAAAAEAARATLARVGERRRADAGRRPQLERERAAAAIRRDRLVAQIPPAALRTYARTAQHRSPAVARIIHGTCSGCRLPVPARVLDQARRDELAVCETCERLLLL